MQSPIVVVIVLVMMLLLVVALVAHFVIRGAVRSLIQRATAAQLVKDHSALLAGKPRRVRELHVLQQLQLGFEHLYRGVVLAVAHRDFEAELRVGRAPTLPITS